MTTAEWEAKPSGVQNLWCGGYSPGRESSLTLWCCFRVVTAARRALLPRDLLRLHLGCTYSLWCDRCTEKQSEKLWGTAPFLPCCICSPTSVLTSPWGRVPRLAGLSGAPGAKLRGTGRSSAPAGTSSTAETVVGRWARGVQGGPRRLAGFHKQQTGINFCKLDKFLQMRLALCGFINSQCE